MPENPLLNRIDELIAEGVRIRKAGIPMVVNRSGTPWMLGYEGESKAQEPHRYIQYDAIALPQWRSDIKIVTVAAAPPGHHIIAEAFNLDKESGAGLLNAGTALLQSMKQNIERGVLAPKGIPMSNIQMIMHIREELNRITMSNAPPNAICDRIQRWRDRHRDAMEQIAGPDEAARFSGCIESFCMSGAHRTLDSWTSSLHGFLGGLVEDIKAHPDEFPRKSQAKSKREPTVKQDLSSVFVVHGRDAALRESTCRLIERLGLKAVVLAEQANQGRTIIEKFEAHAQVGYAIVLFTADDEGRLVSADSTLKRRARQNVILEMGYFLGQLGRNRVACVVDHGIEIPSDLQGIGYIEADPADAWKLQLARELKAAGYAVDLNVLA
jgi:predicted nucleotide-binding protein